jgi:hypothetical protein
MRRKFPLLASIGLIAVGMFTTTLGPTMSGRSEWALPYDLWGTLIAAVRLVHGNVAGLYTEPTGLVSLPGAAVILLPCAAVISATGLSLLLPGPLNLHPPVWLLAGPYQIALSCITLFAADALAEQLGVTQWKRAMLAVASACALWNVSARWGHPEDAVAVALLLYAVLALSRSRTARAGWLAGAAVCVQPLVLLALPVLLAVLPWRRMPLFLVRSAVPSIVLLGAAAVANWHATYVAVTSQPNSPVINHPTAWTSLAPHMSGTNVAAGPARLATIVLACCCALAVRRRALAQLEAADGDRWPPALLADVLWWAALTLALRSFFEPVMVSYYPWPALAVALIPAATLSWPRLVGASVVAGGVTAAAQGPSHSVWIWWVPVVAGLVVVLALARDWRPSRIASSVGAVTGPIAPVTTPDHGQPGLPGAVPGAWEAGRRRTRCGAGGGLPRAAGTASPTGRPGGARPATRRARHRDGPARRSPSRRLPAFSRRPRGRRNRRHRRRRWTIRAGRP